jgi:hypothetical protein
MANIENDNSCKQNISKLQQDENSGSCGLVCFLIIYLLSLLSIDTFLLATDCLTNFFQLKIEKYLIFSLHLIMDIKVVLPKKL